MGRKGAMIKEKWEGKVQLEKEIGKKRYNKRREMGRKGAMGVKNGKERCND